MTQPSFWCVANLGDVDPFEHGGQFVCVDRTGVYPPELVVIEPLEDESKKYKYIIQLERLMAIKDCSGNVTALSDNKFHTNYTAWFGDKAGLKAVADHVGVSFEKLVRQFLSSNPIENAIAYKAASDFFGCKNFDEPSDCISADKAKMMCDRFLEQIEETKSWHQGYFAT